MTVMLSTIDQEESTSHEDSSIMATASSPHAVFSGPTGPSAVEVVRRYIESLPRQVPFKKEIRNMGFWRAVWVEFIVTLLFLVIGCGPEVRWTHPRSNVTTSSTSPTTDECSFHSQTPYGTTNQVVVNIKAALAIGLTVASLVHSTAHVSGCHLNPAVSVGLFVTRNISPLRTVAYVVVQCLGATVGAAILYGLTPATVRHSGLIATVLHPDVHPSQAFGVEFLITLLITITLMASWDQQHVDIGHRPLVIGLAYTVGHLFGYPYTGAGMNPARSLALSLITNSWKYHWVYWAGPILGGILGGFTYEYIRDIRISNPYQLYTYGQHEQQQQQQQQQQNEQLSWKRDSRKIKRDESALNSHETELIATSNDYRV